MHYEIKARVSQRKFEIFRITALPIRGTNYTRYEIFWDGEKLGGYIDRPDEEVCLALLRKHQATWRDRPLRRTRGRAGNVKGS